MREFLLLLLFASSPLYTVWAQNPDTIFLSKTYQKVDSKKNAFYFKVTEYKDAERKEVIERTFLITGEKSTENSFIVVDKTNGTDLRIRVGPFTSWYKNGQIKVQSNYVEGDKEGKETSWYENGQIYYVCHYTKGIKQGPAISYYPDGKVKRQEMYVNGLIAAGKCFTKAGADTTYYPKEEIPEFPGGMTALNTFILNNLKYGKEAVKNGQQGLVVVQFVVNKTGNIEDIKVVKSLSPDLDAESIRVVRLMPKNWKPARFDGQPVNFRYTLPIRFGLR